MQLQRFRFVLFAVMTACATAPADDDPASTSQDLTAGPLVTQAAPLTNAELPAVLDQVFLRATNPTLASAEWAAKWQASLREPVLFFRAFPGGFHKDLKGVAANHQLGRQTLCLGDAHPGNFGFQRLGGKTRYVYNDLDDAGYCPVAFDAARYFAALRLFFDDGDLNDAVLETYVDAVKDPSRAKTLDSDQEPDWGDVRQKGLADATQGTHFVFEQDRLPPSTQARKAVGVAIASVPWLQGWTLLDVAEIDRTSGGSGGLDRYWALLQKGSTRTIVELKQTVQPGTEQGIHAKTLAGATRLAVLQQGLWNYAGKDALALVTVLGKTFLVRDRLVRKGLDVQDMKAKDRERVLKVQASVLADLHRSAWQGVQKDEIRAWVKASGKVVAQRWKAAYQANGGQ